MQRSLNVLVVDDEQIVLDSVKKHLRKENFTVFTSLAVRPALEKIDQHKIDIILTDLMMPDIDGLEFMSMVKEDHPDLPIIMVTGYATINTALQATQLGAFDYIAKPFTKKELLGVLHRAAELVRSKDENESVDDDDSAAKTDSSQPEKSGFKTIGDHSWLMTQEDGTVLLGVKRTFLHTVGQIKTVSLPEQGDELRQGGVLLQVFSSDLQSHSLVTPLSGTVIDVNQKVLDDPDSTLQDPYGDGWLIRLKPSKFDYEIKMLGL
ncbi:MAG: response regulator [candidate division Zixibacteria bacterium]|nr:response regulator [candidate division Zixibacteria bacterium]